MDEKPKHTVRNTILGVLGGLLLLALLIQLVPFGRSHTNPPVLGEPAWDSPQTRVLFMRACGDCHTNETAWPWYTGVAPISWLIQRDVDEGRQAFNVSEWGYRENEADEAARAFQSGRMPPKIYTPMHPSARLTAAEKQQLLDGLVSTFGGELGGEGESEGGDD